MKIYSSKSLNKVLKKTFLADCYQEEGLAEEVDTFELFFLTTSLFYIVLA
jgi:hypothetical protein